MKKIAKSSIDPTKLVGKYIPKVTAKPFQLTKEYFEDVCKLTNCQCIGQVPANRTCTKTLSPTVELVINFLCFRACVSRLWVMVQGGSDPQSYFM